MPKNKRFYRWVLDYMEAHKIATIRQIEAHIIMNYRLHPGIRTIVQIMKKSGFDIITKNNGQNLWGEAHEQSKKSKKRL